MSNNKLLTAIDLLQFVKKHGVGENRTTLTRYQSAGILTLPHQFTALDEPHNDIPDIRTKYYHPISIIEFIVNSLLFKGFWLKSNSDFHIARSTQLDVFLGRLACLSDLDFLNKYDDEFINCGIGSFKNFEFALDANAYLQEPLINNWYKWKSVDRELNSKNLNNGMNTIIDDCCNDQLSEEMLKKLIADSKVELPHFNTGIIGINTGLVLEVLTYLLSYYVFYSLKNTRDYVAYQKMIYSRTFEQVIKDFLPAILEEVELKSFSFYFFVNYE